MSALDGSTAVEVWTFLLVLGRMLPVALITPYLGGRFVPWVARVGLGLVLAAVLTPGVAGAALPADALTGGTAVAGELLLGSAVGFVASLVVYAALMAGAMIDAGRGQRDPRAPDMLGAGRSGPAATLLALLLITVFLALDGHHLVIGALGESFATLPPGEVVGSVGALSPALAEVVGLVDHVFGLAVAVSLPVLAAVVLVALALGLAGRFGPRIHGFFLALPIRALLGLFVLLVGLSVVVEVLVTELGASASWIRTLLEALGAV